MSRTPKITRPSTTRCKKSLSTFAALSLKRLASSVDQTPVVARSQISKPEKKRKNAAVTIITGSRHPLSLMTSGKALRFNTRSITE